MKYNTIAAAIISILCISLMCGKPKKAPSLKLVDDATGITTIKQGEQIKKRLDDFKELQNQREKELDTIE